MEPVGKAAAPIRTLREALGLSQQDFARQLDCRYSTYITYDRGGTLPPPHVVEKARTIAAARGQAHLAMGLAANDWRVRTFIHPPSEFTEVAARQAPAPSQDSDRERWHTLLDAAMDGPLGPAIRALLGSAAARPAARAAAPARRRRQP